MPLQSNYTAYDTPRFRKLAPANEIGRSVSRKLSMEELHLAGDLL